MNLVGFVDSINQQNNKFKELSFILNYNKICGGDKDSRRRVLRLLKKIELWESDWSNMTDEVDDQMSCPTSPQLLLERLLFNQNIKYIWLINYACVPVNAKTKLNLHFFFT